MSDEYLKLISTENIFSAWRKFSSGKTGKKEVMEFWRHLEDNLFELHKELKAGSYEPRPYVKFIIRDPKERLIHKAEVRDRVVHQLDFDYLQPVFEKRFIFDSYSSRVGKGTHRAVKRLQMFCRQASRNNSRPCWILKCDIKKFFDSVDHKVLFSFIRKHISDEQSLEIIWKIIKSYETSSAKGLPLGNLTSQLFANIYLHEMDYFIKHILCLKNYIRFNDDFVIVHQDKMFLESHILAIKNFLAESLLLDLPDEKIVFRKFSWGVDFLGYVVLPGGILLRTKTKKRMLRRIEQRRSDYRAGKISFNKLSQTIISYLGILKHCAGFGLRQRILDFIGSI